MGLGQEQVEPMIPFGCMDLVCLVSGDMHYLQVGEAPRPVPRVFLIGQVTRPYWMKYLPGVRMLAAGFWPHSAHHVLKDQAFRATDTLIDAADFLPKRELQQLLQQMEETQDVQVQVRIWQNFLHARLSTADVKGKGDLQSATFIQQIHQCQGHLKLGSLAQNSGISPRRMQQLFKERVGIRPGLYNRIIRFKRVMPALGESKTTLTQLALEAGYFDQAHFIRDFRQFTGCTPGQYRAIPHNLLDQFARQIEPSLLYN